MRVCDKGFLVLVLLLLICIFDCDFGRSFWPSGTSVHRVLLIKYHSADRFDSMEKIPQINLGKEVISYGGISIRATLEHKNFILTGRKLLMKPGVSSQEDVSKSNTGNNQTMNKTSHEIRTWKTRNMKPLKKKGHRRHEASVGAFTEDYRVPRPHPPRNN